MFFLAYTIPEKTLNMMMNKLVTTIIKITLLRIDMALL